MKKKNFLLSIMLILVFLTGCQSNSSTISLNISMYEDSLICLDGVVWSYSCDLSEGTTRNIKDPHITYVGSKIYCDGIPISNVEGIPINLRQLHEHKKSLSVDELVRYAVMYYAVLNNISIEQLDENELDISSCQIKYFMQIGKQCCYLIPVLVVYITREGETVEIKIDVNSGGYYDEN